MSGSLNKAILIGNLGRDPELKMTQSGTALCRFSIATTETWKNPQGEKQSKTEWHNITVWGKLAEVAEKYLRKGKQVMIEGKIEYQEYKDKDGVDKKATNIRCDNFVMLGSQGDGGKHEQESGTNSGKPASSSGSGGYDDDIPF